jgi:hypothetical protein
MKNFFLFLSVLVLFSNNMLAQKDGDPVDRKAEIEKIKIAYITKKLNLSVEEAQQFWPVYNNYEAEIRTAVRDLDGDEIKRNEAVIAVQKRFKPSFQKVLKTDARANNVFVCHRGWVEQLTKLRNRMRDRRDNNSPRIPGRRGGKNI